MTADNSTQAPSQNVATMSTPTASTSTAATTIVGSPGWLTPKRIGVAEQVAGDTSTSTAALDRTGSTRFTYPGTGNPIASASNNRYIATDYKPGSTAALQAAKWLMTYDFVCTADKFELRWQAVASTGVVFLMVVDGLRVALSTPFTYSLTAGNNYATLFTFPSAATRRIQLYGVNNNEGRSGGIAIPSGYTVTKPTSQGRTIAVVGDSYVNGSGVVGSVQTFAWQMAMRLGADTVIQAGIGATGFVQTLTGQPTSNFAGRASMVLAEAPDVVIIAGGRNDGTGSQSAIESCIQDYLTGGVSAANILVMPTCTNSAGVRAEMIAACATKGVRFLDLDIDSYAKLADTIHPTLAAHQTLGDDAANRAQAQTAAIALSLVPSAAQVERELATANTALTLTATAVAIPGVTATGTASLTVTPSVAVVEVEIATGNAALTLTPSGVSVEREIATGNIALTVTPSGAVVEREVVTGNIALTIDAGADANASGGAPSRGADISLSLTPAATAFASLATTGTAALSITASVASFEAEYATGTAALSVTPSASVVEVEQAVGVTALALLATATAVGREYADGTAVLSISPTAATVALAYTAGAIALHLVVEAEAFGVGDDDGVPVADPRLSITVPAAGLHLTTSEPILALTGA